LKIGENTAIFGIYRKVDWDNDNINQVGLSGRSMVAGAYKTFICCISSVDLAKKWRVNGLKLKVVHHGRYKVAEDRMHRYSNTGRSMYSRQCSATILSPGKSDRLSCGILLVWYRVFRIDVGHVGPESCKQQTKKFVNAR
jgi:hypothetical protein